MISSNKVFKLDNNLHIWSKVMKNFDIQKIIIIYFVSMIHVQINRLQSRQR